MITNDHILITGAIGFVGRHLSEALLSRGARVSQIVRSVLPVGYAPATQHVLDLTNRVQVADIFSVLQPDYVIHLAGSKKRENDVT